MIFKSTFGILAPLAQEALKEMFGLKPFPATIRPFWEAVSVCIEDARGTVYKNIQELRLFFLYVDNNTLKYREVNAGNCVDLEKIKKERRKNDLAALVFYRKDYKDPFYDYSLSRLYIMPFFPISIRDAEKGH